MDSIKIFSGNATPKLTQDICNHLGVPLGKAYVGRFPNGEIAIKVNEDIRGCDVFVVQSTCPPVNENLMELLLYIDCFKRASAERITAVIPQFGYDRQDRKDEGRVPISAKLVANMLVVAGANRILTIDLHAAQIQGFFDIPVDHLYALPIIIRYFQQLNISDLVVTSPDVGSMKINRAASKMLASDLAVVDKERLNEVNTAVSRVIGEVKGKNILMIDDTIHTAGSIVAAAELLANKGAKDIYVAATHGVFCGPAYERIAKSAIKEVVVTDTIPLNERYKELGKIKVLTISKLLADAIKRIHFNESISELFKDFTVK